MRSVTHSRRLGAVVGALAVALAAFAIAAVVVVLLSWGPAGPAPDAGDAEAHAARAALLASMEVAEFEGVDQLGRPVDRSLLEDGLTVLSFGFTNCTLACPMLHGQMYRIAGKLEGVPVRFVTISVDPVNDTVERLADYADEWGVAPDRWRFVRVDREALERLLLGLGFGIREDPSLKLPVAGGGEMANIVHPTRVLLIGPGAEVIGMYRGMEDDGMNDLARRVLGASGPSGGG